MENEAGTEHGKSRAREFDSPRGHVPEHEYATGYVGLVCLFFSVGGLVGMVVGGLIYLLFEDRPDRR